jgi:AraC-like DNA-binding protein
VSVIVDTGAVPPDERFDLWAESATRVFEPMLVSSGAPAAFQGRVWRYGLGPLTIFRVRADASAIRRTPATIAASDPERVQFALGVRGRCAIAQDGREAMLTAGNFGSWASSRPYVVDAQTPFELLVTYCPAMLLGAHGDVVRERTGLQISGGEGLGRLVRGFILQLVGQLEDGTLARGCEGDVAEGLVDLLRGLHGVRTAPEASSGRAPDVLRAQVRAFIDTHLGDPALGPEANAREHFISRSYLDKLLEADGTSVRESIRDRRLDRCRRDLQDPSLAGRSILDIASRWGFVSASHFSRTFRAAYGLSPRDARRGD